MTHPDTRHPPRGDGYGSIFVLEICTEANPRWRRSGTTYFPTFGLAAEKLERRTRNSSKRRKREFRVAEYIRHPEMAAEMPEVGS